MEGLLKWSIAAQSGDTTQQPNERALAQLLGAPDDLTLMKNALHAAVESTNTDERIECLDQFEEHVENADNANNIGKLWEPLIYLVKDKDEDVRAAALSCVAAAVQNNEKSQLDLVATKQGIPSVLESVSSSNTNVSTKALLALSCAVAHCLPAYDQFTASQGWEALEAVFTHTFEQQTGTEKKKSRVLSLIYAIVQLLPNAEVAKKIDEYRIVERLSSLTETGLVKEKITDALTLIKETK